MISVLIPMCLLLGIILINKIPYIGGQITIGLLASGLSALILGGIYSPIGWIQALVSGIDKLSWVMALAIFGSIYSETQVQLGTMETVLKSLRSRFGRSPKGLVTVIIISLVIAGSLLGDAIASSTVIGVLVIGALAEIKLTPEQITAVIVMGASLGSIMPPIAQAFFLSSSLMGLPSPDPVINIGYFTVGLGVIICSYFVANRFVKIDSLPESLIPEESAFQIIRRGWKTLVPLIVLASIVILRSGFQIEVLDILNPIFDPIKDIPIVKGLNFPVVKALIVCIIISYAFPAVRRNGSLAIENGLKNVKNSLAIQICAGFMIGAFYAGGQIQVVQDFAQGLGSNILKIGGSAALCLIGMLTGSQSTAQTSIFTFFGPALESIGVNPVKAAVAGAHLAASGQGMPPADLTAFVVAGMVGGFLGKKVDPVRAMIYSMVMSVYSLIVGIIFLYI